MMERAEKQMKNMTDISETLLIPLYSRAFETQSDHPLINDRKAVEIIEKLNPVDQRLLKARYELNCNANSLAVQLDRSVQYVYKHLARILHSLNVCVKRVFHEAEAL